MRVLGRSISAWWLVAFVPLGVCAFPALVILFFAANNFAGAVLGPPAIWNRPWHQPQATVLVGKYRESERHWSELASAPATLELRSDGSASASQLPSNAALHTCVVSGVGKWSGPDQEGTVTVDFSESLIMTECHVTQPAYATLELAGHSQPYSLYLVIDDPDSGTGLWFEKGK